MALGSAVDGPVGMLTTSETLVRARVARADAGLVAVGSEVDVEIHDAGVSLTGTVLSVGEPQQQPGSGEQPGGGSTGGSESGRMEVVVAPSPESTSASTCSTEPASGSRSTPPTAKCSWCRSRRSPSVPTR